MRSSVLDIGASPLTDLRPGETGLRLKDDPYYGKVDLGAKTGNDDDAKLKDFEKKEREKIAHLPAGERAEAEEKLGRELAKKSKGKSGDIAEKDRRMPSSASMSDLHVALGYVEETIENGSHVLDGDEQGRIEVLTGKRLQQKAQTKDAPREAEDVTDSELDPEARREASRSPMEPAERDRDKTKAAKPGESAKG